jgi:hypothetical protein
LRNQEDAAPRDVAGDVDHRMGSLIVRRDSPVSCSVPPGAVDA